VTLKADGKYHLTLPEKYHIRDMIPESGERGFHFRKLKFCKNTTLGSISKRYTERLTRGSGRWGVVHASEHQEILVALASLIRAQRYDMALAILDNELGGGC